MSVLLLVFACFDEPDLPHPVASGEDNSGSPADSADSGDAADSGDTAAAVR